MLWMLLVILILLPVCWVLLAPFEISVDTRILQAAFRWRTIGNALLVFENDKWMLQIKIFFFRKQWELEKLLFKKREKKKKNKPKSRRSGTKKIKKMARLLKTFRISYLQAAIDTGDSAVNALLYPVYSSSYVRAHLKINFADENYLVIKIRNAPWKLIYAFMK